MLPRLLPVLVLLAGIAAAPAAERPNLILVVMDDLRREDCNWIRPGVSLTPVLDRLAAEGAVLTNLHSPSPVCTPSRYALLTGRSPATSTHTPFVERRAREGQPVIEFNTFLPPGSSTIGRHLAQAGYATGFYGKNHVIHAPGWTRGVWESDPRDPAVKAHLAANAAHQRTAIASCGFQESGALYYNNPDFNGVRALAVHNQEWIVSEAAGFITRQAGRPFFLYMGTTAPHLPDELERGHRADPLVTSEGILDQPPAIALPRATIESRLAAAGLTREAGLTEEEYRQKCLLLWMDDSLGALLGTLRSSGTLDNTVIVITSDHGMMGKGTCYDDGTRTAALLWRSGGFGVRQVDGLTNLMDIPATCAGLAGASPFPGEGHDLTAVLAGTAAAPRRHGYAELGYARAIFQDGFRYLALRPSALARGLSRDERQQRLDAANAELTRQGKVIFNTDPMAPFGHLMLVPGGGHVEQVAIQAHQSVYFETDQLYDTAHDPAEQRNLIHDPAQGPRLARLRDLLRRELAARGDAFPLDP